MSILINLFIAFFKIGLFTIGGGYAMLPLIQQEVVRQEWLPLEQLIDFIAVSESTPGPFAINIATYIGTTLSGIPGAVCATLGVVMPSFIIILLIAKAYAHFSENRYVKGVMRGLKPAVVGLIGAAIISLCKTVLFPVSVAASFSGTQFYVSLVIAALSLYLILKKKVHPIWVILLSAALGIAAGYLFGL